MSAWDDHKWVRPEPGSVWTFLPGGAALFTVTPQAGGQWPVVTAPGATLIPEMTEILTELRRIRVGISWLMREYNVQFDLEEIA